jgi:hypothetical protein
MNYLKIITMLFRRRSHGKGFDVTEYEENKLEMVSFI